MMNAFLMYEYFLYSYEVSACRQIITAVSLDDLYDATVHFYRKRIEKPSLFANVVAYNVR